MTPPLEEVRLSKTDEDEDLLLYHYTSIDSFHSIFRSGKVWASDCRYLNDSHELAKAQELFLSKFEGKTHEVLSLAFHWHSFSRCHCVFSLSRSPEVLSQWRAYADDGKGLAIGFKAKYLSGHQKNPSKFLVDCIYKDHDDFISTLAIRCAQDVEELSRMYEETKALNTFWQSIDINPMPLENLYSELLRVKNGAFKEEQEVRLVINVSAQQAQTRTTNGLLIPYFEHTVVEEDDRDFFWCIAPEIWLGPKCSERNIHAIGVFRQTGWTPVSGIHRYECGYI